MAKATAGSQHGFRMDELTLDGLWDLDGEVSKSMIRIDYDATSYLKFTGAFILDSAGDLTGGKVTGVEEVNDGRMSFRITGVNATALQIATWIRDEDIDAALGGFLANDDTITGSKYKDVLWGLNGDDRLEGGAGDDVLEGGYGNDVLDGGSANDRMVGDRGSDTYVVSSAKDKVVELRGDYDGDLVKASISYTLPAHVENLTLTGKTGLTGKGNRINNVLTGTSGKDTLYGNAGADKLIGGDGDDRLVAVPTTTC